MQDNIHVVGISGSLRKASINTGLLRAASLMLPEGMTLEVVNLSSVPLYNDDITTPPDAVKNLKSRITSSDALLIATPEYNYSVSGVLKNAIDWISRPPKENPLIQKPVAMFGAAGVMGTVRAQAHLRQILQYSGALVLPKPEVYITRATEKVDHDGNLIDDESKKHIRALLDSLKSWVLRVGLDQ